MVRFKVGWGVRAGGKPGIWGPGQGNNIDSIYGAFIACLTQCLQAFSHVTHPHTTSNTARDYFCPHFKDEESEA